jgi:hypothetical protein
MQEVIALRPLTYGTRRMRAGDRFTASDAYARLMIAVGNVRLAQFCVETAPAGRPPALLAGPVADEQEPKPKRRPRTYKRRDMRAED